MKNYFYLYLLFLISLGCKSNKNENKTHLQFVDKNGQLTKEGYFNNQGLPVDTLKTYKNGKLERLEVYNDSGRLDGLSLLFYPTGSIEQKRSFENGVYNGFVFNYYPNGKIKSKGYCKGEYMQGDNIHYYENGSYKGYNFLDFQERNLLVHLYDTLSNRIKKSGTEIVVDSISYWKDTVTLKILLAHPPFSRNIIYLSEIDRNGRTKYTKNIPDTSFYISINIRKVPEVSKLLLHINQFDSVTQQTNEKRLLYELYD